MLSNPLNLPVCDCGHLSGDHLSNRTTFPHPVRLGLCREPGCDCKEFSDREAHAPEEAVTRFEHVSNYGYEEGDRA